MTTNTQGADLDELERPLISGDQRAFIAALLHIYPALSAELRNLRAERERLREALRRARADLNIFLTEELRDDEDVLDALSYIDAALARGKEG